MKLLQQVKQKVKKKKMKQKVEKKKMKQIKENKFTYDQKKESKLLIT